MTINITYCGDKQIVKMPEKVDLVGITVLCQGNRFSVVGSDAPNDMGYDREVVLGEEMKVILHYYVSYEVFEIAEKFAGFEGMEYIEIKGANYSVSVTV